MRDIRILFLYANCMMENLLPVGPSAVLGGLKKAGFRVRLFDTTFYRTEDEPADMERVRNLQVPAFNYEDAGVSIKQSDVFKDFRSLVDEYKPHIIMASVVESTYSQAIQLLDSVKGSGSYNLAGGVFAILSPDEVIANSNIDAVCSGEGEDSVVEFCRKFAEEKDYTSIPGMWFKKDGRIIKNPIERLVDLDSAPYLDFSLYEKERFYKPMQGRIFRMLPIEFSRGCPYRCSYCVNHALEHHFAASGKWFRSKSMERIFAEIREYVERYKAEFFYFISESFLSMPAAQFDEFCRRYAELKIPFWFNTRPETITAEKVNRLKEINCFRMGIGLEHGNEEFRKRMLNRHVSNEKIVEACRIVEGSGIGYSINNIIGFPGETRELVFDTIELNRQIHPNTVGTFVFTPFKGTDLYDYCLQHGYITAETRVGDLNRASVLQNNSLSELEIRGLLRTFPLYVHFKKDYYPQIQMAEYFSDEGNEAFRRLSDMYTEEHFRKEKR